jgi:hypothetical protein
MPPNTRAVLWNALKDLGWTPEKGFTGYTVAELSAVLTDMGHDPDALVSAAQPQHDTRMQEAQEQPWEPVPEPARSNTPDPSEMPGQRQNMPLGVIRIDDQGRQWYQEEVRKPAYPKPRGRRVLKYLETGVKTETVQNGEYVESFEVAGELQGRPAEVKITLPSYQVGIYKDPRFPFKIHCYNEREGFDLFEVQEYYGGAELVPPSVKRIYIENELCYDVRSVIQTIQAEYRQLVLQGGNR